VVNRLESKPLERETILRGIEYASRPASVRARTRCASEVRYWVDSHGLLSVLANQPSCRTAKLASDASTLPARVAVDSAAARTLCDPFA
jgi:hypothetical protein